MFDILWFIVSEKLVRTKDPKQNKMKEYIIEPEIFQQVFGDKYNQDKSAQNSDGKYVFMNGSSAMNCFQDFFFCVILTFSHYIFI